jgi:hypothetical protein
MRDRQERVRVSGMGVWQWGVIGAVSAFIVSIVVAIVMFAGLSRLAAGAPMGPMAGAWGGGMAIGVVIVYPILGFIGGILAAAIYNLAGLIMGGLEIEVSG